MGELQTKTIKGAFWNGIERFSSLFIQLISTLVIARILTPSDFGLIGMLAIFNALGTVIVDSGFSQALIRQKNTTNIDYSSVLYFNIFLSISTYILLFFLSPSIANFYNTPELEKVARVSFLSIPINAISLIHQTILQKKMDFKSLSKISISSSIVSGIIGILIAYYLKSVWALIFQLLIFNSLKTSLYWIYSQWKPTLNFSLQSIKKLSSFSFNLLLAGLTSVIFDNLYTILIGKYYSASDLGLYTQSKKIAEIPTLSISNVVQKVTYPSLSVFQTDINRLKDNYLKIIRLTLYIVSPISGYLIITAPTLFDVILGKKWEGAIFYFQVLCLIGVLYPISSINLNILKITGKSNVLFRLELIKKIIMTLILIYTIHISLVAVVYGNVVYSIIAVSMNMYYSGKEIQLKIKEQLVDIIPAYILTIAISCAVFFGLKLFLFQNSVLYIFISFTTYFSLWLILTKYLKFKAYSTMCEIKNLLISSLKR